MPAFDLSVAAAYVVITAATGLAWSILVWHIRLLIRTKICKPIGWDDVHCTIATVFGVINSAITILETRYGIGRRVDRVAPEDALRLRLLLWIAAMFYQLTLCSSILSAGCLLTRVARNTNKDWVPRTIAVATCVWAVISFFLIVFICQLPKPEKTLPPSRYVDVYQTWMGITIFDSFLDLCNFGAVVLLLWDVKMPWRTKVLVFELFASRLLVIPPMFIRLHYVRGSLSSKDWTYSRASVAIVTQIAVHLSIILTTVLCAQPYLNAFESGAMQAPTVDVRRMLKRPVEIKMPKKAKEPDNSIAPPVIMPPSVVRSSNTLERRTTPDSPHTVAADRASHRRRVQEWPVQMFTNPTSTVTSITHDPEDAKAAERKRSIDSASMEGITRRKSFAVDFEDVRKKSLEATTVSSSTQGNNASLASQQGAEESGDAVSAKPNDANKLEVTPWALFEA